MLQKITYSSTTLAFTRPCRPWIFGTAGIGAGVRWSAAGVPSTWVTRWERSLTITQRLTEAEWPAVRAWLDYARAGGTFSWFPDATLSGKHICYLIAPTIDEDVRPTRGEFPGEMEVMFTIRRTDGSAIQEVYF